MQRRDTTPVKSTASKTNTSFEKVGSFTSTSQIVDSSGIQKYP